MNWELIKKGISKEIESTINTIDPAFDIDVCLNLYFKILKHKISFKIMDDLDGLEKNIDKTLSEVFIEGRINSASIGTFCKNFEPLIKKIYYLLQENDFVNSENLLDSTKLYTLSPFLSVFNKIRPIYLDDNNKEVYEVELASVKNGNSFVKMNTDTGLPMYKKLFPGSLKFDKYNELDDQALNDKYQNNFILYLVKAIILKNEQSHQVPDRNTSKNIENLNSTLLAELWIIDFFKKELTSSFRKESYKANDFTEYFKDELKRLENQSSKFVSLNLKELSAETNTVRSGFIEDILSQGLKKIRVLGQGGAGKTTTLEYLLYCDINECIKNPTNSKIPVLISLASVSNSETVLESIAKKINIDIGFLEELLKTNMLKIYLDGINEMVGTREAKKTILNEIASVLEDYPELCIIITDRFEFDSYQNNMFQIPTFIIQKLNASQIEEFVEKYCYYVKELSFNVLKILKSKKNIQELLSRPLVLTRAIEIIKSENDLPEKEGHIIEKFIDGLLRREKDDKMDPLLNVNNFKLLLSYAADNIYHRHRANAPVHEFYFNKLLIEAADKFGLEKFNAGYVSRIGYELEILSKHDERIKFYHQSYLDFFCKHYLKYEIH